MGELLSMLLGSSALGTLIGGVFAHYNKKAEIEAKKVELSDRVNQRAHELALRQNDLEQIKAEAAGKREVAVVEGDATIEAARMTAIAAANSADKISSEEYREAGWWKWLLVWSTAFRTWIRPMATVALTTASLFLTYLLITRFLDVGWLKLDPKDQLSMANMAINWVFAQASASLSYWFLSRGSSR